MVVAAARVPSRRSARASSARRVTCGVGQGGQRQAVTPGPAQRCGGWRAGISAGPGRVERVPVQGGTQHCCWRPAPPGREESWGDGGQRVGDPRPGAGCRQRPFHRSVGRRVLQPADGGWFGRSPGRRFPGSGAEVQALAGSADELGPVTVRQAPGDERPRPGPAAACQRTSNGRRRSGLRRIAWIRTSNALMLDHPPQPPRHASAHMASSSSPRLTRRAGPRLRWPSGRSTRLPGGLRRSTRSQPRRPAVSTAGSAAPAATQGEHDSMRQRNTFGPNADSARPV